jgi:predicted dehydrogenase
MEDAMAEKAERLRFGIVGCGVIGCVHAEAIASLPDAGLVAVADVVPERAQQLADMYQAVPYGKLGDMLERERLDVVDVCTVSGLHGEHACQVMHAGRHVIVEKPMEISRAAMDEMLHVQREAGVKLAVISQHRFDPASRRVRALVDERAFGRLVLGNAIVPWWRSQAYYDSAGWRGTWKLDGGGILMNQAIHSIDLLQWLMGPVSSLHAYSDTQVHRMETEDVAVAVLRFASGALGAIAATTGAYPGAGARIELLGDRGSAAIENDRLSFLHLARDDREEVGPYGATFEPHAPAEDEAAAREAGVSAAQDPTALAMNSHAAQIADMIEAIRTNGTPLVDGHAGRRPVDIILGIYESARTGREVTLA